MVESVAVARSREAVADRTVAVAARVTVAVVAPRLAPPAGRAAAVAATSAATPPPQDSRCCLWAWGSRGRAERAGAPTSSRTTGRRSTDRSWRSRPILDSPQPWMEKEAPPAIVKRHNTKNRLVVVARILLGARGINADRARLYADFARFRRIPTGEPNPGCLNLGMLRARTCSRRHSRAIVNRRPSRRSG